MDVCEDIYMGGLSWSELLLLSLTMPANPPMTPEFYAWLNNVLVSWSEVGLLTELGRSRGCFICC